MILPTLDTDLVASALGVPTPTRSSEFSAVVTDSRKVRPGSLFVALAGEKFDGHTFIPTAIEKGATGVICKQATSLKSGETPIKTALFFVSDTLQAYRKLAGFWRRKFDIPVIAIAGSVGKTTTKELLAAILLGKWKHVLKTQGSQNGYVGIPMTLLDLRADHQAAVIEVGIDDVGAMKQHIDLIAPTHSLLTAIGPEHLEKLKNLETVAAEENMALHEVLQRGGTVSVNLDDPWIRPAFDLPGEMNQKWGFSLSRSGKDVNRNLLSGEFAPDVKTLILTEKGGRGRSFPLPLPGRHNAYNLLAAVCAARSLGLTFSEIETGLGAFSAVDGRSEIRELKNGVTVICDYYNANPSSTEAGLRLLHDLAASRSDTTPRRVWACLGDMLEMGPDETRIHRDLAPLIIKLNVDQVLLLGPRMKSLCDELIRSTDFHGEASHFETHSELAQFLLNGISPGNVVLIKGSRGMKMEEVWKILQNGSNSGPHS